MAARNVEQPIRFEPDETYPPTIALVVGLQGAALILAPTVMNVAVAIRSAGLDDTYLTWGVFTALLISAAITALQAFQAWRFGAGHIVLTCPAALFIGIMVATVSAAGPSTFMSLLVICCVIQVALAWWLPTLRRIFTPVVTGTVTMLIAVSVLPIAFDSVQDLPVGAPPVSGPAIAGVTLLVSVIVTLRASGRWRLAGPFISILAGCATAAAFGLIDADRITSANWFGIPELPALTLDLTPGKEFWALLPSFAILTLVIGIKTISDGVAIQQGSRRRPRSIDFRQIQGMTSVNGIGMLLAGIAGTLPPMSYSSFSLSLISLTGVAARRVGIGVAVVLVVLAFFSKLAAVLLTIPGPVLGAYLMLAMGMLFVRGWQTILRDGLDPRRVLVVALASALGLGLHNHSITRDLFGDEIGGLLGNRVTIGAVVAIGMTLLLEAMNSRRSRLEVTLDMASLPALDEFLTRLASRLAWNEASTLRLRAAGEETLASLLALGRDDDGLDHAPLIIDARPQVTMVDLEFVATTRGENVEDQLAYLTDEAPYQQSMIFLSGCCDTTPLPCVIRNSTAWISSRFRSQAAPESTFGRRTYQALGCSCVGTHRGIGRVRVPAGLRHRLVGQGLPICELFGGRFSYKWSIRQCPTTPTSLGLAGLEAPLFGGGHPSPPVNAGVPAAVRGGRILEYCGGAKVYDFGLGVQCRCQF